MTSTNMRTMLDGMVLTETQGGMYTICISTMTSTYMRTMLDGMVLTETQGGMYTIYLSVLVL